MVLIIGKSKLKWVGFDEIPVDTVVVTPDFDKLYKKSSAGGLTGDDFTFKARSEVKTLAKVTPITACVPFEVANEISKG